MAPESFGRPSFDDRPRYSSYADDSKAIVMVRNNTETPTKAQGFWLPDDIVGEILLFVDESNKSGLKSLLAVSAVSTSWRAVANRLPQWSVLVRSVKLPCPTFNRAQFIGTRNAVFRPYTQAKARYQRPTGCCRGVCLPILLIILAFFTILFGALALGTTEDRQERTIWPFMVGWRDVTGKPVLCYIQNGWDMDDCFTFDHIFEGANKSKPFLTSGHIEPLFEYHTGYGPDRPVESLRWVCPTDAFTSELSSICRLQAMGTFLTILAAPLLVLLGCVYARATSSVWQRNAAIGVALTALFCMCSMTSMFVGGAQFDRFSETPCDPEHRTMRNTLDTTTDSTRARSPRILEKLFATSSCALIMCAIGISVHAVFVAKLLRATTPSEDATDPTPEDAEIPPGSIKQYHAEQHDILIKYRLLASEDRFRNTHIQSTRSHVADFSGQWIGISVRKTRPLNVQKMRLFRFDRLSLLMFLQDSSVVDIGLGHRLEPSSDTDSACC